MPLAACRGPSAGPRGLGITRLWSRSEDFEWIPLQGPLAFVRITPDRNFMAVGVIHERHSAELHAQLRQSLQGEPEEDVNVEVLNRNFEVIATSNSRSSLIAPTLLNEGQTELLAQPNNRYRISMRTWDNHATTIARFESSCTPLSPAFQRIASSGELRSTKRRAGLPCIAARWQTCIEEPGWTRMSSVTGTLLVMKS